MGPIDTKIPPHLDESSARLADEPSARLVDEPHVDKPPLNVDKTPEPAVHVDIPLHEVPELQSPSVVMPSNINVGKAIEQKPGTVSRILSLSSHTASMHKLATTLPPCQGRVWLLKPHHTRRPTWEKCRAEV